MNKRLITTKLGALLLAVSIAGASLITAVAVTPNPKSDYRQHGDVHSSATTNVYKLQKTAIQFDVPQGWQVKNGDNGGVTAFKSDGNATIAVSMAPLGKDSSNLKPEALFKLFSEGVLKDVKKDFGDSFKTDEPTKVTRNGISEMVQTFTGKENGVEMQGAVFVLYTDNPVGVFAYGNKNVSQTLANEIEQLLHSLKKIE